MGGSAALRYARYADAVCALAPQVSNLAEDPHVGREDLHESALRRHVEGPLLTSVERALRRRIPISVHFCAGHACDAAHVAENLDALSRAREPLAPAERAAIDAIPHLVAGPRNRPTTADAFGLRGGARPEL